MVLIASFTHTTPLWSCHLLMFGKENTDWKKNDDIEQLDVNTRKMLSMTDNLHRNSEIDYIYMLVDLMVGVV